MKRLFGFLLVVFLAFALIATPVFSANSSPPSDKVVTALAQNTFSAEASNPIVVHVVLPGSYGTFIGFDTVLDVILLIAIVFLIYFIHPKRLITGMLDYTDTIKNWNEKNKIKKPVPPGKSAGITAKGVREKKKTAPIRAPTAT